MANMLGLLKASALFVVASTSPLIRLGFLTLNLDVRPGDVNRTICLGPLGCFSNGPPFYDDHRRPISLLPFDRSGLDVRFLLYTRRNPVSGEELKADDKRTIIRSFLNPAQNVKIIIHGLLDNLIYGGWLEDIKREYLYRDYSNVILVDWARANQLPYEQAVANSRAVGAEIAHLIQKLTNDFGVKPEQFHLIGHSLGAHVAGYTGKKLPGIARITGLDPAGPYFTGTDPRVRLDHSDANFVDVIHTDASTSILSGLGTVENMGHVDFYPNGGNDQPGCSAISNIPRIFVKGFARSLTNVMGFCDHMRAGDLFAGSINVPSCAPMALRCPSWSDFVQGRCGDCNSSVCLPMGEGAVRHFKPDMVRSKFYLRTADVEPYCLFQYQITMTLEKENKSGNPIGEAYLVITGNISRLHIKLSNSPQTFRPGSQMNYLVSSRLEIGDFEHAIFYWMEDDFSIDTPPNNLSKNRLYISKVRVSPLQLEDKQRRGKSLKPRVLCSDPKEPIFPNRQIRMRIKSNC